MASEKGLSLVVAAGEGTQAGPWNPVKMKKDRVSLWSEEGRASTSGLVRSWKVMGMSQRCTARTATMRAEYLTCSC